MSSNPHTCCPDYLYVPQDDDDSRYTKSFCVFSDAPPNFARGATHEAGSEAGKGCAGGAGVSASAGADPGTGTGAGAGAGAGAGTGRLDSAPPGGRHIVVDKRAAKAARKFFKKFGFVVFRDLLTEAETASTRDEMFASIEKVCPGFRREDQSTWSKWKGASFG